jgi:hypothetical protein
MYPNNFRPRTQNECTNRANTAVCARARREHSLFWENIPLFIGTILCEDRPRSDSNLRLAGIFWFPIDRNKTEFKRPTTVALDRSPVVCFFLSESIAS